MMEQQGKLVNTVMQQNAELMEVNRELRQGSARPESTTMRETFKMTQPKQFCGGAWAREIFIGALGSNIRTYSHLFPNGDSDKVQYALDHLGSWANHSDQSQQKTSMTDPVSRAQDLRNQENLRLEDFDLFTTELRKMYGDKELELNAATRAYHEFPQGYHDPKEGVRAYANRLRRNWREADWDQQIHHKMLYGMVWSGLKEYLVPKIKPFTDESGRFNTIDELFDRAEDVESPPKADKQHQQQHQQTQPGDSKKGNFRPSIPKPTETTQTNPGNSGHPNKSGGGNRANLSPAPWLTKEAYEKRRVNQQCTRCGSKEHKAHKCTKYGRPTWPDRNPTEASGSGSGEPQVKRQKSFDTQQSKN